MKPLDFKTAIAASARRDIGYFADRLGLLPESPRTRKMFAEFQELARLMRRFNPQALARIVGADLAPVIARRRESRRLMNSAPYDPTRERAILAYRDALISNDAEEMATAIESAPDEQTRHFLLRLESLESRSACDVLNDALMIAFWVTNERMEAWTRWHDRLRGGPRITQRKEKRPR